MVSKITKLLKRKQGQGIVEFALIAPVFLLLVIGIMEAGRVLHAQLLVTEAAREGARAVAISGDRRQAVIAVSKFPGTFTTRVAPSPLVYGQAVSVEVSTTVEIITPMISKIFKPNPFPVSSTANMREENSSPLN